MLPTDFPPKDTVYTDFKAFRVDGTCPRTPVTYLTGPNSLRRAWRAGSHQLARSGVYLGRPQLAPKRANRCHFATITVRVDHAVDDQLRKSEMHTPSGCHKINDELLASVARCTSDAAALLENRMANFFTRVLKAVRVAAKPSAAEANARGQEAMQRGEMQEAVEHFTRAMECAPDEAVLIYNRGHAYLEAGELELAKADFDLVIEMTPDDPDPYFRRGLCSKKQDNHAAAVKDFTRAIKLQPENSLLYNFRGVCLRELGELDKAMADFDKALKVDPEDSSAHANRALILEDRGQLIEAIKALTQSIEVDPSDADDWNRRGLLYHELSKYNRAIADYTQAIRLRPDSAAFYCNRASSLGDSGRTKDALVDYQKCLRLDPKLPQAMFGRGWMYATAKDAELGLPNYERGLADFEKAIAVDPQFGSAYGGQSYCLARLGREREAFRAAEREIEFSRPEGLRSRGHVNLIMGHYEAGFTDLKEAFRLQPEKALWANQIAWMRATLSDPRVRNPAEALQYAKIACRLTSNKNWNFLSTMAGALADAGRWDEAVSLQEKVVAAVSNSSDEYQEHLDNYRNRRPTRNEYSDL